MIDGNASTDELMNEAERKLSELRRCLKSRRQRDRACRALTDLHVSIEHVAKRLGDVEFAEAPVSRDDDEEPPFERADGMSMAELFAESADEAAVAEDLDMTPEELRLTHFRAFIDFLALGCDSMEDVTKRAVAIIRRVRPDALRALGVSQADMARMFGEQRATTSAREKRVVEGPLKASGARGYLVAGGARGGQHRGRCAEAQKGNSNRRTGEARRRATD